jgi:hypothetical protein
MITQPTPVFQRLLEGIQSVPVIDCHEHLRGPARDLADAPRDPIQRLSIMYFYSDLWSASDNPTYGFIMDTRKSLDERWPVFERLWRASEHTGYARITKLTLKNFYEIDRLTRSSLDQVAEVVQAMDEHTYLEALHGAGIRGVIADNLFPPPWERTIRYYTNPVIADYLDDRFPQPQNWRPVFNLPYFHEIRTREFIDFVGAIAKMDVLALADYEEAMFRLIQRSKEKGIAALKDQSAYRRVIDYDLPATSEAECLFNKLLRDPRNQLAWPEAKPLDDYLFHRFMRIANQLDLPVQIHTGHMATIRNRVDKANAAHFTPVLELYSNVQFDLFHGNWPYMDDLLFIGKNYPNAHLDLCWTYMIDPLYAKELLKRALVTIPHVKIHAFGGDFFHAPEFSAAVLVLAREVIAAALAEMVETGWLEEAEAECIAVDWLYNNPNNFYRFGLPAYG